MHSICHVMCFLMLSLKIRNSLARMWLQRNSHTCISSCAEFPITPTSSSARTHGVKRTETVISCYTKIIACTGCLKKPYINAILLLLNPSKSSVLSIYYYPSIMIRLVNLTAKMMVINSQVMLRNIVQFIKTHRTLLRFIA